MAQSSIESSVKMPYHKPNPPTLAHFRARIQEKQKKYGLLKESSPDCLEKKQNNQTFTLSNKEDVEFIIETDVKNHEFSEKCKPHSSKLEEFKARIQQNQRRQKSVSKKAISVAKGKSTNDAGETFSLSLDEETESGETISSQAPGAKLIKLKEKLQLKMREKRDEARQRRVELYNLDNENNDENEESEAEMTDESDTDEDIRDEEDYLDDEDEEEAGEDEMEDDDEEIPLSTKKRKRNLFLDDEAADNDDDDDESGESDEESAAGIGMQTDQKTSTSVLTDDSVDKNKYESLDLDTLEEEDLHLAFTVEDDQDYDNEADDDNQNLTREDNNESDKKNDNDDSASKDFAVKLPSPLMMYSEEANDESPMISQKSDATLKSQKSDTIELSDRPFETLSQNTMTKVLSQASDPDNYSTTTEKDSELQETQPLEEVLFPNEKEDIYGSRTSLLSKEKDSSLISNDSSFDLSMLPLGQRSCRKSYPGWKTPDLLTPSSKSNLTNNTLNKSTSRLTDPLLRMEDTQDLMNSTTSGSTTSGHRESTPKVPSQNPFRFQSQEETSESMLDADGFIKDKSAPLRRQLMPFDPMTNDSDELLGLCSGKFDGASIIRHKATLFEDLSKSSSTNQSNMDELLRLCSGQFNASKAQKSTGMRLFGMPPSSQLNSTGPTDELLGLCSGKFIQPDKSSQIKPKSKTKRKRIIESDEESNDNEEIVKPRSEIGYENKEENSNDEQAETKESFKQLSKMPKEKLRAEFFEQEAELSGSECSSDEELDEKDDNYERMSGDDDELPSGEDLRNQVGRVHMKNLVDQDKRELRLMQEMYFEDGDLHSDGKGRQRRFRWKNSGVDDDNQNVSGSDNEADSEEEEAINAEIQRRKQRIEREKFLEEQSQSQSAQNADETADNDSQLFKLCRGILKKQNKRASLRGSFENTPTAAKQTATVKKSDVFKVPTLKPISRGSLLGRSREALDNIARLTKSDSNPLGPRHSKNFVFSCASPEPNENVELKKSNSLQKTNVSRKRPKLERSNTLPPSSIFHLLDK